MWLVLALRHLPWGGELRGVPRGIRGRRGYRLPDRDPARGLVHERRFARRVGGDALLADECFALAGEGGVGVELDRVDVARCAVQLPGYRGRRRRGLGRGDHGEVLQPVGSRVRVEGIVRRHAEEVSGEEIYAEPHVVEDGVARDRVADGALATGSDPGVAVEGYGVGPRRGAVTDPVARGEVGQAHPVLVVAKGTGAARVGADEVA